MDILRTIAAVLPLLLAGCFEEPDAIGSEGSSSTTSVESGTDTSSESTSEEPSSASSDPGSSTTVDASSSSSSGGQEESTTSSGCGTVTVEPISVHADTHIDDANCNGTIVRGGETFVNIGLGVGLYRFELPATVAEALRGGDVEWMELTLTRDVDCVTSCPAEPGSLEVRPLRNDWVEGVLDVQGSGADWCRRNGDLQLPEAWGEDGALAPDVDVGPPTGSVLFDLAQPAVTISLDAAPYAEWVSTGSALSVRVSASSGAFVAATRENPIEAEPLLRVAYCPPG